MTYANRTCPCKVLRAKIGDVPGPYFIREFPRCVGSLRRVRRAWWGGSAARVQPLRSEKTVKRRERTPVLPLFSSSLRKPASGQEIAAYPDRIAPRPPRKSSGFAGSQTQLLRRAVHRHQACHRLLQCTRGSNWASAGQPLRYRSRLTEIDQCANSPDDPATDQFSFSPDRLGFF